MGKVIFNADDFGISRGVNEAGCQAYHKGILNAASLMVNQKYAPQAVALAKKMPNLDLGLHVNLTNEYPAEKPEKIPLLVGQDGKFKNGFLKLLLLSFFKPRQLQQQARFEIEAQILKAKEMGADIKHLDGHRHVQMIPVLFDVFEELRLKYHMPHLRIMNECALLTLKTNKSFGFLLDGALIKYFLLRILTFLNGAKSETYFYTMLYTCKLSRKHFEKVLVPQGFERVEVMIHPNITQIDKQNESEIFDKNVLSIWRDKEFETLLDKSLISHFVFDNPYPKLITFYQKLEKFWFSISQKIRFLLVGGFNTVFAYSVYALLVAGFELPYLFALIIQNLITINVSIITMRYYVFQSHGNFGREYAKAWGVYIWMFFFNSMFLSFLIEVCHLNELLAQALYLCVSTLLTYILHKYFSFYKKIKQK